MKAMLRVFRYEFLRQIRRKGYIIATLGVPIIALAIFYGVQAVQKIQASQPKDTAAQQADEIKPPPGVNIPGFGSPLSEATKPSGYIDYSGLIKKAGTGLIEFKTEDAAQQAINEGQIRNYYIISKDYLQNGQIDLYFMRFNLSAVNHAPLRNALLEGLRGLSAQQIDDNTIKRLQDRALSVVLHAVSEGGKANETNDATQMIIVYVFVLVLMFTAFTSSGYMMQSVVEEKENRMVEVLLSSLRPRDLLAGKFLALSLLSLGQMALWFATGFFLLRQMPSVVPSFISLNMTPFQVIVLILYFILGFLFFCASYAAIGALVTNMREGPQLAAFVTVPAVVPMYAIPVMATSPNGTLAVILSTFPITSPVAMVVRTSLTEVPVIEVVISVVLLVLLVIGTVWFAARVFRVSSLLSGQMPSVRDIVRLVRERA